MTLIRHIIRCLFVLILTGVTSLYAQDYTCNPYWYEGEGTHYGGVAGSDGGNCSLPVDSGDFYHAAINQEQYDSSNACGSCVHILGPKGEITLKIVDRCPECLPGDIDMTTEAFEQLADLKDGRIPIRWQFVACKNETSMELVYASGTGPYYFKAQLRNLTYPVHELAYKTNSGDYATIPKTNYNYFVASQGIDEDKSQTGPYDFRITSANGSVLEIENVPFQNGGIIELNARFNETECEDCSGVTGGEALTDNCGACSGGTTGIIPNTTCEKDCNGYWNGTAYTDTCGTCVSGTTGRTPCGNDCNGDPGGAAFIDLCGQCSGGNTGVTPILSEEECTLTRLFHTKDKEIRIYPNPFQTRLFIQSEEKTEIEIYTSRGTLLRRLNTIDEFIRLEDLATGIYLLKISTASQRKTFRIQKK